MTDYIERLQDHQRIHDIRLLAKQAFDTDRWPTTDDEEWRRSDISVFDLDALGRPDASVAASSAMELKQGRFLKLQDALEQNAFSPEVLDRMIDALNQRVSLAPNRISLWNLALSEDIFVLHFPANVVDADVHQLVWNSAGEDVSRHATIVVVAETLSRGQVSIILDGAGGHVQNLEAVYLVDDGAHLNVQVLQKSSDEVLGFYQAGATVGRDAELRHFEAVLGGGYIKNRVEVALAGSGSDLGLDGVYFTNSDQHVDLRTVQHHQSDHATSRTFYKGAMTDESEAVFQGLIEVNHEAPGTDAYLTNNNLVLNDGAKANSIPSLNIKTDDVSCSHGSTTGKIDEEQLYYLQCRGFTRAEGEELLILGFFEELIERLEEHMQEDVRELIHNRLRGRK